VHNNVFDRESDMAKKRAKKKTLGKYGPPGEIKYRPPADGNKRSALERAAALPKLPKGQTRRKRT
jgi:hypothetical protein